MIIKKMSVTNFANFQGKHVFELQKGLNIIAGPGMSGKTNLTNALKFAFLGQTCRPRNKLINIQHKQECLEKSENPFCRVEIEIQHKSVDYLVQSELSLVRGKKISQSWTRDLKIDQIITSKTFKQLCLHPSSSIFRFGRPKNLSTAEFFMQTIIKHLQLKVEPNIKTVILDGIFSHMGSERKKMLMDYIISSRLEQTIILEKYMSPELEAYPFTLHNLTLSH